MRFVQAFLLELWRHIGPETAVPAGDIGVGGREVGFLFGMYKKLSHEFTGTFTGKEMCIRDRSMENTSLKWNVHSEMKPVPNDT